MYIDLNALHCTALHCTALLYTWTGWINWEQVGDANVNKVAMWAEQTLRGHIYRLGNISWNYKTSYRSFKNSVNLRNQVNQVNYLDKSEWFIQKIKL